MRLSHRLALAVSLVLSPALAGNDPPRHQLRSSAEGNLVVGLCDGETSLEVKGVKPGDQMTREQGQQIADALMTEWRQKHPDAEWIVAAAEPPTEAQLPGVNVSVAGTDLDEKVWLVKTWSDRTRGDYYVYDGTTKKLDTVATVNLVSSF